MQNQNYARLELRAHSALLVRQRRELAEFLGFETRNKYAIQSQSGEELGFAAEQGKGLMGLIGRNIFGHWRSFEIHFFDAQRRAFMIAEHPFRFYFHELVVREESGRPLGSIKRRFAWLSKSFEVLDARGQLLFEISSPIWKIWSFPFARGGRVLASVDKKWSGLFFEGFTDKDNFLVQYPEASLTSDERLLILAAAIFIDLMYFEKKAE